MESLLSKRYYCYYDSFNNYTCSNSGWDNWGRWVLLGLVIAVALLFMACAWYTSYRRRRRGARPLYGTGWMTNTIQPAQGYTNNYNTYNRPAPPPPQELGGYGYGSAPRQEEGVYSVPPPEPTYAGVKEAYAPPGGPPPSRY